MDWRERDYYLVKFDIFSYKMRMECLKRSSKTMRVHAPYNHIKVYCPYKLNYDGVHKNTTGIGRVQFMLSCRKEDSDAIEFELRKAHRRDGHESDFVKLSKEMCGH